MENKFIYPVPFIHTTQKPATVKKAMSKTFLSKPVWFGQFRIYIKR